MPNWCVNEVMVMGSEEEIYRLLDTLYANEKQQVDFNKIIPMPEELNNVIEHASLEDDMKLVKKEMNGEALSKEELDQLNKQDINPETKEFEPTRRENAKLAIQCIEKYGYKSWYDFSEDKWGTPSNSDSSKTMVLKYVCNHPCCFIYFMSAWTPPIPVFDKLAKMFPNLVFNIFSSEEGMRFKIMRHYANGNLAYCLICDELSDKS